MIDVKTQSEELTVARFDAKQDRIIRDFGYGDTVGAMGVAKDNLRKLSAAIALKISEAKNYRDDKPEKQFCRVIEKLDTDVVALSALQACLHSVAMGDDLRKTALSLGYSIAGECWANGLLTANKELAARINRAVKKKHGNLKYRKQAARSIAARAGFREKQWDRKSVVLAGGWLLDCVLTALPDVFELVDGEEGDKFLTITKRALEVAEASVEQAIRRSPVFLPTPEAPAPWTDWAKGGYWDERSRLRASAVRTIYKETAAAVRGAMRAGTMAPHISALNSAQNVAFTINVPMLKVVEECYRRGIAVKGLPSKDDVPEPERPFVWSDLSDDEKRLWRHKAAEVEKHNRSLIGERIMFAQDMGTAEMLSESPRFYTPMNCDWRGRFYSVCNFNFQRDDRVRSLFLFADGLPIGEEGLYWLKVHVANCGDFDKISKRPFDERVKWVDENLNWFLFLSERPMDDLRWTKADKPFLFLAASMELRDALRGGPQWVTKLPVSFDGSCSGLQHLTAMTRASEGKLVNLTVSDEPQDVYQTVADVAKRRIERDEAMGIELAKLVLKFGVTRKVVKRNVMTYSYSSKKFGMAKQQDEDLIDPLSFDVLSGKLEEHPFGEYADKPHPKATTPAAKYLAEHVYEAIKTVVDLPQQAMVLLQKTARALAHEGKPVSWITPTGLPWSNRYHSPLVKRVELWLHDTRVQLSVADGATKSIDKEKAANGIAPNFVHALDAAHLALTVNAAVEEGITNIATVHDSFGCLAPQATRFNQIIREQFVKMYEEHDVLNEVLQQASCDLTVHNKQRLPEGLQYGTLNLRDILKSKYAFA